MLTALALLGLAARADDPRASSIVTIPWEGAQITSDLDNRSITGAWQGATSKGLRGNALGDLGLQTDAAGNRPHLSVDGFVGYYSGSKALENADTTAIAATMADFCKANSITPCTLSQINDTARSAFIQALSASGATPETISGLFTPTGWFWSAGAELSALGTSRHVYRKVSGAEQSLVDNAEGLGLEGTLYHGFSNNAALAFDLRAGGSRTYAITTAPQQRCTDASDASTCTAVDVLTQAPSAQGTGYFRFSGGYYGRPSNKTSLSSAELRGGLENVDFAAAGLSAFQGEAMLSFRVPVTTPGGASSISVGLGVTLTQPLAAGSVADWEPEVVIGQYSWL